jgi:hypothetical protein
MERLSVFTNLFGVHNTDTVSKLTLLSNSLYESVGYKVDVEAEHVFINLIRS